MSSPSSSATATNIDSSETSSTTAAANDMALHQFIQQHNASVPYVSQSYSWDCGLACVQMALRAKGNEENVTYSDLRRQCTTDSIWSIDIAYLLKYFRLQSVYYTVMKGVRPEYREQEFYRTQISDDTKRVNQLFQNAEQNGVVVIQSHVSLSHIRRVVSNGMLALTLMDKRLLKCCLCDRVEHSRGTKRSIGSDQAGFVGHYVLLYGYFAPADVYLIKDPAARRETCVISADVLQEARLAFGTDQDILFIDSRNHDIPSATEIAPETAVTSAPTSQKER